jgi:tyrosyl-tRNA synthetase
VTARVHGQSAARAAADRSEAVFGKGLLGLDLDAFLAAAAELPRAVLGSDDLSSALRTVVASGAASSNGEARRLIQQGGVSINDVRIREPSDPLPDPVHDRFWVVRTGKKHLRLVERRTTG